MSVKENTLARCKRLVADVLDKGKQNLVDYAEQLEEDYIRSYDFNYRKTKGQFFTPKEVSLFMIPVQNNI